MGFSVRKNSVQSEMLDLENVQSQERMCVCVCVLFEKDGNDDDYYYFVVVG